VQHADQFTAIVEDRSAGVTLPGEHANLEKLIGMSASRSGHTGKRTRGLAVLRAAEPDDCERVATPGTRRGHRDRLGWWMLHEQGRQIPRVVTRKHHGLDLRSVVPPHRNRMAACTDDVPVCQHDALLATPSHQNTATQIGMVPGFCYDADDVQSAHGTDHSDLYRVRRRAGAGAEWAWKKDGRLTYESVTCAIDARRTHRRDGCEDNEDWR